MDYVLINGEIVDLIPVIGNKDAIIGKKSERCQPKLFPQRKPQCLIVKDTLT